VRTNQTANTTVQSRVLSIDSLEQIFSGVLAVLERTGVRILCDEIIGMVRHIVRGFQVDEAHLALDVIDKVGPMGQFLSEKHSVQTFRSQFWLPSLVNRQRVHDWERAGRPAWATA